MKTPPFAPNTTAGPHPAPAIAPSPPKASGRNGKVAALPKPLRDNVNQWLQEGLQHTEIIRRLGEPGKHLTFHNISTWKKHGHQKWLKDQFWREDMLARLETFTDLLNGVEPIKLPEAGLQLAAIGTCELLRQFCEATDPATADPHEYVRVANSLARIARSVLLLQQYRDTRSKESVMSLPKLPADRDLAEREREAILDKADDIFGFKSYRRLLREPATAAPAKERIALIAPEVEEHPMT